MATASSCARDRGGGGEVKFCGGPALVDDEAGVDGNSQQLRT